MQAQAVSVGEIVPVEGGGHIVKATGRKDRHSKVYTARGLRDRRVRLSALTAIQFYDVQDRLGFDRPSKAVDWLMKNAKSSIDELTPSSSSAVPVPVPVPLPEPAAPSAGRSRSRDKAKQPEPEPDPDPQSQAQTAGGGGGGEPSSSSSGSERFLSLQQQQHQFSSQEEPPAPVHSPHVHHLVMQNHGAAVAGGFISASCDAVQTELQPQSVYQALLLQNMAAGGMFQEPPGPSRFRTPGGSFPPSSQFARSPTVQQFPPAETLPPWMPATPQQQQQQQQQQQFGFGFGFGFGVGVGVGVGADFRKETLQSSSGPAFLAGSNPHHLHPHLPQQQQQFFQNHQFTVSPQGPSAVAASFSGGGGAGGFSGFRIPARIQGIDEQDGGSGTAESKPPSAASSSSHFG